jgi:hypothetical protein
VNARAALCRQCGHIFDPVLLADASTTQRSGFTQRLQVDPRELDPDRTDTDVEIAASAELIARLKREGEPLADASKTDAEIVVDVAALRTPTTASGGPTAAPVASPSELAELAGATTRIARAPGADGGEDE